MALRVPYNEDITVRRILERIKSLVSSGEKVYYVNVHCVGAEFRIGTCSLEAICADWRTWYDNRVQTKLTEEQYQKIKVVLDEQWVKDGKLFKDRGLY